MHRAAFILVTVLAGALFILGAITFVPQIRDLVGFNSSPARSYDRAADAVRALWSGDFDTAASKVSAVSSTDRYHTVQQLIKETAQLSKAETDPEKVAALKLILERYDAADQPAGKAAALNRVLGTLNFNRSPTMFREVFGREAFRQYLDPESYTNSLRNLAAYSVSLHPTWYGQFFVTRFGTAHKLEAAIAAKESSASLKQKARALVADISKAEDLYERDKATLSYNPLGITIPAWFNNSRGYYYGVAAQGDKTYLADAEAAYRAVFAYYEQTRDADGKPYPILAGPASQASLNYAVTLYQVAGNSRVADIKLQLDAAASLLQGYREEAYETRMLIASAKRDPKSDAYNIYVSLAKISPAFKAYLVSQGWEL